MSIESDLAAARAALETIEAQRDDMLRIVTAAGNYVRRGPRADGAWMELFDAVVESRFSPFERPIPNPDDSEEG